MDSLTMLSASFYIFFLLVSCLENENNENAFVYFDNDFFFLVFDIAILVFRMKIN